MQTDTYRYIDKQVVIESGSVIAWQWGGMNYKGVWGNLGVIDVYYLDCSNGFTDVCVWKFSKLYLLNIFSLLFISCVLIKLLKISNRKNHWPYSMFLFRV